MEEHDNARQRISMSTEVWMMMSIDGHNEKLQTYDRNSYDPFRIVVIGTLRPSVVFFSSVSHMTEMFKVFRRLRNFSVFPRAYPLIFQPWTGNESRLWLRRSKLKQGKYSVDKTEKRRLSSAPFLMVYHEEHRKDTGKLEKSL